MTHNQIKDFEGGCDFAFNPRMTMLLLLFNLPKW